MYKNNWIELYNLESNQDYVEKTLKEFNINKYHYIYDKYGNLSLLIEQNLKKYKIIVDDENLSFNIYRCDVHNNFKKHTKENMILKKQYYENCIYNSIKWIYNNSLLK